MKKMLIVLTALTVMGAGFVMAEDQKTEAQKPSQAYMFGYNSAMDGSEKTICNDKYGNTSNKNYPGKTENTFDCYQGYVKGSNDNKEISGQSKGE